MFSPRELHHQTSPPARRIGAAVLARLGFRVEGLAKDYLFIDGAWRDHQLTALTNPGFSEPSDW